MDINGYKVIELTDFQQISILKEELFHQGVGGVYNSLYNDVKEKGVAYAQIYNNKKFGSSVMSISNPRMTLDLSKDVMPFSEILERIELGEHYYRILRKPLLQNSITISKSTPSKGGLKL